MLGFVSQVSTESKAIKREPVYKRLALTVLLKQFGLGARSPRDSGQSDTPPCPVSAEGNERMGAGQSGG